ncbi:hypothetical protein V7795_25685 [Rhizobium laguerreae]|nr:MULTISPECIES: hypothetical protein [Rhizobium]
MHPHLAGLGFTTEQCSSVNGAVEEADIVTTVTATVRDHPVGQPCQPGIHMNAVVGMPGETELSKDIPPALGHLFGVSATEPHRRPDPAVAGPASSIEL